MERIQRSSGDAAVFFDDFCSRGAFRVEVVFLLKFVCLEVRSGLKVYFFLTFVFRIVGFGVSGCRV